MEKEEIKYLLWKACFKQLNPACQELMNWRFKGLNSQEIAQKLATSPDKVDQQMYACRELLRKCCEKQDT